MMQSSAARTTNSHRIEIIEWSEDAEEQTWADGWQYVDILYDGARAAFLAASIRIASNMEMGLIAVRAGRILGATVWRTYLDVESKYGREQAALLRFPDPLIYDFDIAVQPAHQGGTVGYMLVEAEIRRARQLECGAVCLQVINPKMTALLVKLFGFTVQRIDERPFYRAHVNKWL